MTVREMIRALESLATRTPGGYDVEVCIDIPNKHYTGLRCVDRVDVASDPDDVSIPVVTIKPE